MDSQKTEIEGAVMVQAQDQAIPRVIAPASLHRTQVGGLKNSFVRHVAECTTQSITPEYFETKHPLAGTSLSPCPTMPNAAVRTKLHLVDGCRVPRSICSLREGDQSHPLVIIVIHYPPPTDVADLRVGLRRDDDEQWEPERTAGLHCLDFVGVSPHPPVRGWIVVEHVVITEVVGVCGARVSDAQCHASTIVGKPGGGAMIPEYPLLPALDAELLDQGRRNSKRATGFAQRDPELFPPIALSRE